MLSRFKQFLQAPVFDDPEMSRRALNLHIILTGLIGATLLWAWYPIFVQGGLQIAVGLTALGLLIGLFLILKRGSVRLAGYLFSSALWAMMIGVLAAFGGVRNSGFATLSIVIVIASLTLGARAGIVYAILTIAAAIGLDFAETLGWLPPYVYEPNLTIIVSQSLTFVGVSLLLFLAIRNINNAMENALKNEKAQVEINALLETSQAELQQRTALLEQRGKTLQTTADVAHLTSRARNEQELLEQSAKLLAENIRLEHVSIFMLDQPEESAILFASSSAEGKDLIADGYQLKAMRTNTPHTILGADTLRFQIEEHNYYLDRPIQISGADANLSLPLASGERLLGLINIQTASSNLQDVEQQALQTFADQIALSVENIRLVNQLQTQVQEIEVLAGRTIQGAWDQLRGGGAIGYTYDRLQVLPADESFTPEVANQLLAGRSAAFITNDTPPRARLVAPIGLRENIIGVIGYDHADAHHEWQDDERAMLETVATRVSLALENTRLVAEAQQRAERERVISQVSARMRETLDIDTILKTAVNELRQSLALNEAEVRLQSAERPVGPGR